LAEKIPCKVWFRARGISPAFIIGKHFLQFHDILQTRWQLFTGWGTTKEGIKHGGKSQQNAEAYNFLLDYFSIVVS
jgi:hypothetical protein